MSDCPIITEPRNPALLIEVTIFDEETGEVVRRSVHVCKEQRGYRVRGLFGKLGDEFSKLIDPYD